MTHSTFTVNQLKPLSIGFDNFYRYIDYVSETFDNQTKFPAYNISTVEDSDHYLIEMALAGYGKQDISLTVKEGILTISSDKVADSADTTHIYKGITTKAFSKSFTLSENMVVTKATMTFGMLRVYIERIIPEEKKVKNITIE